MDVGYAGALLGGVLTLLSPCAALLLPAFFAYALPSPAAVVGRTGVFALGLLSTLLPLGLAAGTIATLLTSRREVLVGVAAALVIVLGVTQALGWGARVSRHGRSLPPRRDPASLVAVFALGAGYGVAGVCSGPILGSVLAVAAFGGDPYYGAVVLALYAAGMVLPLLALALGWERWGARARWLRPRAVTAGPVHTTVTDLVAGIVFIAVGMLLWVTDGTASLGGLLDAAQQRAVEVRVLAVSQDVPDLVVVAGLAVGAGAVVLARWRRSQR